jgi:hypothetical protein
MNIVSFFLELPSGNNIAPYQVRGIRRVKGKGLVLTNEYNKLLDYYEDSDDDVCKAFGLAIKQAVDEGKRFHQPDWESIRKAVLLEKQTRPTASVVAESKKPGAQ